MEQFQDIGIAISWGSALISGLYYLASASIFDARQARFLKEAAKHPYSKPARNKPRVAVIIIAQNSAGSIEPCLDAIRANKYRKTEIIVLNNASSDKTAKALRSYRKEHPETSLTIINKRKKLSYESAAKIAVKQAKSEKALLMKPTYLLAPNALSEAVLCSSFGATNTYVDSRFQNAQKASDLALATDYYLFYKPKKKSQSLRAKGVPSVNQSLGLLIDRASFDGIGAGNQPWIKKYAKAPLTWLIRASWWMLIVYCSFLAVAHQYPILLALLLLSALLYSVLTIFSDNSIGLRYKVQTLLALPGSLSLIFLSAPLRGIKSISADLFKRHRFKST